jgi:ABC-type multidrug transport system fused ATPase/permease subunit
VLDGVDFKICPGERVAIVGGIGCGKTTMLKMLFKFLKPQQGALTWGGVDLQDIPTSVLRERVAMIPQMPVLFNRSIYDNITYGHEGVSRERVMGMLAELGLDEVVRGREGGLDFVVGKNGSRLSGGQRQLIWCMRVMLGDPQLLLMDEPTASIDKASKERLLRLLRHMMKDRTVVMVTHDEFLMRQATRVLRLCDKSV